MFKNKDWGAVINALPIGIFVLDSEFVPIFCNDLVTHLTGYVIEDLEGYNIFNVIDKEDKTDLISIILKDKDKSNIKIKTKKGEVIYCTAHSNRFIIDDYHYIFLSFIDISQNIIQRELLQKTNSILKNFAHMTAHDLKGPIISLSSLSDKLSLELNDCIDLMDTNSNLEIEKKKKNLKRLALMIQDSTMEMKDTIESSLRYAENDSLTLSNFKLNLAVNLAKRKIRAKKLNIDKITKFNYINTLPEVHADIEKMVLVFQNLFSNAFKFNDKEEIIIDLWSKEDDNYYYIYIRDNGVGIEQRDLSKVFTIYKRLHGMDVEGSGLGLAIADRIIKSHGGLIDVTSEFGVSTTFMFTIPKKIKQ